MPNLGTGIDAQLGFAEEVTHGSAVVVDRFYEFLSEGITNSIARIDSQAIGSGRTGMRRWAPGAKTIGGEVQLEMVDKGLGLLLKHAVGGTPATSGVSAPYTHVFTPGAFPAGLTAQVGRPATDGTVHPFTYPGCIVTDWNVSMQVGEVSSIGFTLNGKDETTGTALATRTLPADLSLMTFVGGTLTVGGTEIPVTRSQFSVSNGLQTDRWKLGSDVRRNPKQNSLRDASGSFSAEFEDLTLYNAYVSGADAQLELVNSSGPSELRIKANVRYNGSTPTVSGPDELPQEVDFQAVDNGTLFYEVTYKTPDATP